MPITLVKRRKMMRNERLANPDNRVFCQNCLKTKAAFVGEGVSRKQVEQRFNAHCRFCKGGERRNGSRSV